jgi:voltage-gated potassium channel
MDLFIQLAIGSVMIGVTVALHAFALDRIIRHAKFAEEALKRVIKPLWRPIMAALVVVTVFVVNVVHMWLWAFLYMGYGCQSLDSLSDALYFSTVTYTTLGSADGAHLGASCHMLTGVEGANGFLLFGWTTAFIFEIISQIYYREIKRLAD